jgi:outer membrane protein assembly factor BamB
VDRLADHQPQEFAAATATTDVVYVGSQGGGYYALSAKDGQVLWQTRIGPTSSRPLLHGGRLYVGADDGTLWCLDPATGFEKWKYGTKGAIGEPPVLLDNLIIFSNSADQVFALEVTEGKAPKWKWQYDRETPDEFTLRGHAGVAAEGGQIFAGFSDGNLVALSAASGDLVWVRSLAGDAQQFVDVDATPVVEGGIVYASAAASGLFALDAKDGSEKWQVKVAGAGPVVLDGKRLYAAAASDGLLALDRQGHVLWRQGMAKAGDPARPLIVGNTLLLSVSETGLLAIDKDTGELRQKFDPGPGVSSTPAVAGERMYLLSNGGILYALAFDPVR